MTAVYFFLTILCAYLLGSLSFAIIVSKLMGLTDPRDYGSHNPGATNVLRSGNKVAAMLTLLGDAGKGWLAVFLAQHYAVVFELGIWLVPLIGFAVFVGHLYPLYHHFKGGKGVATACGVLFGLNVWLGLATLLTWLMIAVFFRYSSLAAIVAAVFAVFYNLFLFGFDAQALIIFLISGLLIYRHRGNIAKLIQGKEGRFGEKASPK